MNVGEAGGGSGAPYTFENGKFIICRLMQTEGR